MAPKEYRSLATVGRSPFSTSGAANIGVVEMVTVGCPSSEGRTNDEIPKSARIGWLAKVPMNTLAGFTSRCTIWRVWAVWRAAATFTPKSSTSLQASGPSRSTRAA